VDLFKIVTPKVFFSSLRMGAIAVGMTETADRRVLQPTTLSTDEEAAFAGLYDTFLGSLAEMNARAVAQEQRFLTSVPVLMDLSTHAARHAIAPDRTATLRMSMPLLSARVRLLTYATSEPTIEFEVLPVNLRGRDLCVELPALPEGGRRMLRQCLEFQVWLDSQILPQRFQVLS
jgi:hypothetical protein